MVNTGTAGTLTDPVSKADRSRSQRQQRLNLPCESLGCAVNTRREELQRAQKSDTTGEVDAFDLVVFLYGKGLKVEKK